MPAQITMPQLTDTMTEGAVAKWLIKEGDRIKNGQGIYEVETDKATQEVESFESGTVAALLVKEGEKVPVGALIAVVAVGNENPADVKQKFASGAASALAPAAKAPAAAAAAKPERIPPQASRSSSTATLEAASAGEIHEPANVGHGATRSPATAVPSLRDASGNGSGSGERVAASPLARRIAAEKGIDLSDLRGSGPRGRIVQKDVLSFTIAPPKAAGEKQAAAPALPTRVSRGETEVIPLTKMRGAIAAALQKSKQTVPHFYETIDIDVEELSSVRARINKKLEPQGVKLSISDFVSKAVASALLMHPAVNAHFTGDSITRFGDVNLGIAVAIPDGLIVPVLRGVDQMGLKEIRAKSDDLIKRARAQKLKQDEMRGATFTVSNLGTFGVREFSAIINPPEVAILAVAAAEKRAVVRGDQIVARTIMTVTLSSDHRAVDGAVAADFLRTLKGLLEEPAMMLA